MHVPTAASSTLSTQLKAGVREPSHCLLIPFAGLRESMSDHSLDRRAGVNE